MKYHFLDFSLLQSIPCKMGGALSEVYRALCADQQAPIPATCLLHALRGLSAGGYVEVEPENGILTVSTPIALTDKGRETITPKGLDKLFNKEKATVKKELAFCNTERPAEEMGHNWTVESEGFDAILREQYERREVGLPTFEITDLGDGYAKLTVHHPSDDSAGEYDAEDIDPDAAEHTYSASVTGTAEQIKTGLRDLIDTAYLLVTETPLPRKVALHGGDSSLLISLANAANEQGYVEFRMTVSKIRFNRQRFVGKRDSELDYAQCGDPIFIHELTDEVNFAYWDVLHSAAAYPLLLDGEDMERLHDIHRLCRPALI